MRIWTLLWIQVVVVATYAYAAAAYLTTNAAYFPEQARPGPGPP